MNIADVIIDKAEGTEKPYRLFLFRDGNLRAVTKHQTHHLAWGAGENWNMLNKDHTYSIAVIDENGNLVL